METNKGKGIIRMNGKMIFKFTAVAAAIVCVASARVYAAASIQLAADDTTYFGLANGNALPAGSAVYMGQFSISDAAISALAPGNTLTPASYAALVSAFIPLTVTPRNTIGTGALGDAGAITASYVGTNTTFQGGPIYLMVVNTSTTAGATQAGVFRGDSAWTYPANMASGAIQIDTDNALTSPLIGTYAASLNAAAKGYTYDADSGNSFGTISAIQLDTIVPEPSTYVLVGTGLLGLLGLRRRNSK